MNAYVDVGKLLSEYFELEHNAMEELYRLSKINGPDFMREQYEWQRWSTKLEERKFYRQMLERVETVDTPTQYARWIENDNGTYSCSNCKAWIPKQQFYYARYCLHCGARMCYQLDVANFGFKEENKDDTQA